MLSKSLLTGAGAIALLSTPALSDYPRSYYAPTDLSSWFAHSEYTTQGVPGIVPATDLSAAENEFSTVAPASVSSYFAHEDYTTYEDKYTTYENKYTTAPAAAAYSTWAAVDGTSVTSAMPAAVSSYIAHSDYTTYENKYTTYENKYSTYDNKWSTAPGAAQYSTWTTVDGTSVSSALPTSAITTATSASQSVPTGVPASVSSYLAHSDYTTYENQYSTAYPWTGADGPWGAAGGYGPYTSGAWVSGPYTAWWHTGAVSTTTATATGTSAAGQGACPPASWPGWTTGVFASSAPWTTWTACMASQVVTDVVTVTDSVGATVTEEVVEYSGLSDEKLVKTPKSSAGRAVGRPIFSFGLRMGSVVLGLFVVGIFMVL